MTKTVKKDGPKKQKRELELDPNAWPKFEALVKSAAKMGHKPHDAGAHKKKQCP